ncbi:MAG: tetratricopeptide repeat protein [Blastocatellia bacterium]
MSVLITKAKSRSSASRKLRATKGKKSPSKKPQRPGRITTAPKSKKAVSVKKKTAPAKKSSPKKPSPKKITAQARRIVQPKARSTKVKAKVAKSGRGSTSKPVAARKSAGSRRLPLAVKLPPPPPKKPPAPGTLAAVRAFEQALRLFNRHDYGSAKSAFEGLQTKFGDEAEVVARARTYLAICEQRLGRAPAAPRNADALYDQGVFEFNRGAIREAIELFEKALRVDPRADHVFYSLAAAHARLSDSPKALDALRRAIAIRPVHRPHARRDLDFANLRSNEEFQSLTGFGFDLINE